MAIGRGPRAQSAESGRGRRKTFSLRQLAHDSYRKSASSASPFPGPVGPALSGTSSLAVTRPPSVAANQRVAFEPHGREFRIIEREMEAAALFAAQRRIDDQRGDSRQVPKFQQVHRHLEIPVKLTDLALEIAQPRGRAF